MGVYLQGHHVRRGTNRDCCCEDAREVASPATLLHSDAVVPVLLADVPQRRARLPGEKIKPSE